MGDILMPGWEGLWMRKAGLSDIFDCCGDGFQTTYIILKPLRYFLGSIVWPAPGLVVLIVLGTAINYCGACTADQNSLASPPKFG